jgi:hypothetical protein
MAMRLVAAGLAYLACFAVSYGLVMPRQDPPPPEAGAALLQVVILNTAALSWLVLRSREHGWRLIAILAVVFFGVQTFMPQVESVIFQSLPAFARHLPIEMVPRIFLAGLLHAVLWAPAAVVLLGKRKGEASPAEPGVFSPTTSGEWASRLAMASALYVVLYFTFGYFVAWRNPAVTAYYEGTDSGSFWQQMGTTLRDTPWLVLAQALRGLLWAALALVVIRTLKTSRVETALCLGTLFAVVMSAGLLLPNPFMPHDVRMAHLAETASSDFIFGVALGWLFRPATRPGESPLLPRAQPRQGG